MRIPIPEARLGIAIFWWWVAFVVVTALVWYAVQWWHRTHPREARQPFAKALRGRFARSASVPHTTRGHETKEQKAQQ